ncbi:MAG: hypothetical protein IPN34_17875 [Planctomycetes bacterium]|nr:hypothetical protein [Planctomycetota bacterium]
MERIQPLLGPLAGAAIALALRLGHELTSTYQQLDPLPGFATFAFLWVALDLRLRLRDRDENRVLLDLRAMAAGSSTRAELLGHVETQLRAFFLASVLLLPTLGLPGAASSGVALLGCVSIAVAVLEGGSLRFGAPNLFLGIALAWFWTGAGDLAPDLGVRFDPWSRAAHPGLGASTAGLGTCLRAASAQLALALALRVLLLEHPRRVPTATETSSDQVRR